MFQERNHLLASEKKAKFSEGPIAPKPGPMFISAEITALIALREVDLVESGEHESPEEHQEDVDDEVAQREVDRQHSSTLRPLTRTEKTASGWKKIFLIGATPNFQIST